MENVHVFNIGNICIHGKNYLDNWHSIKNTKDLTMKQMFDISAKLVSEQDEIYDNDNDNDTLREVPHQSNEGLALQARVSGPWPL